MLNYQRVAILQNPMKPSVSYGFPLVFQLTNMFQRGSSYHQSVKDIVNPPRLAMFQAWHGPKTAVQRCPRCPRCPQRRRCTNFPLHRHSHRWRRWRWQAPASGRTWKWWERHVAPMRSKSVMTNIVTMDNCHLQWVFPYIIVIFHRYVNVYQRAHGRLIH